MQAVRRLYLYAVSGVTLAIAAAGMSMLLEVLLDALGMGRGPEFYGGPSSSREQLSLATALVGVGFPVWAVHWWLAQRGLRPGRPGADAERESAVRALFLALVLLISLSVCVSSAADIVRYALARATAAPPDVIWVDPIATTARALAAAAVWLYHGFVRRADLRLGPVSGAAAWFPRLYLYGISLVALVTALGAVTTFTAMAFDSLAIGGGNATAGSAQVFILGPVVDVIAWGLVWAGHWRYTARVTLRPDWRGAEERASWTRLAAFIGTILVAAAFTIGGIAGALSGILGPMIGADDGALLHPGAADRLRQIVVPLVSALVWGIAWWTHLRWLRREPAAADPGRLLSQVRLESHGVAAVALAFGATALGWLIGILIDIVFGGTRTAGALGSGAWWRTELASWLPTAVVGAGFWLWRWSPVLARRTRAPEGEAGSTIRRGFLYLTIAVALVASVGSAALVLYRVVGTLLGVPVPGNVISELSTPIGALLMALAVVGYHGIALRADMALAPGFAPMPISAAALAGIATPTPAAIPGGAAPDRAAAATPDGAATLTPGQTARRRLALVGPPGTDLDAALAAARAALPEGVRLDPEDG